MVLPAANSTERGAIRSVKSAFEAADRRIGPLRSENVFRATPPAASKNSRRCINPPPWILYFGSSSRPRDLGIFGHRRPCLLRKRNDRIDASKLADCLHCDFLP